MRCSIYYGSFSYNWQGPLLYHGGQRLFNKVDRGIDSSRPHGIDCRWQFVSVLICRYGSSLRIHTDQGRVSSQIQCMLGKHLKEPYNNVKVQKDDWDQHFPLLTMAYSSSLQESPKCTLNILKLLRKTSFHIDLITGLILIFLL